MHDVTPSVVAMAVSILIATLIINFQVSFFIAPKNLKDITNPFPQYHPLPGAALVAARSLISFLPK